MSLDLVALLPRLLPRAIAWAEARSAQVLSTGQALHESWLALAKSVGVAYPDRIRIGIVDQLPFPEDSGLREAALRTGLLGPGMVGVTLGYGIYLCDGHINNRVISHECRHVYQYETAGSIQAFLPLYLEQIAVYGYDDAPLEIDARNHETA